MATAAQLRKAILACVAAARAECPDEVDTRLHVFVAKLCESLGGTRNGLGELELDQALWSLLDSQHDSGQHYCYLVPLSTSERLRQAVKSAWADSPGEDQERVRRFPAALSGWLGGDETPLGTLVFSLYRREPMQPTDPATAQPGPHP